MANSAAASGEEQAAEPSPSPTIAAEAPRHTAGEKRGREDPGGGAGGGAARPFADGHLAAPQACGSCEANPSKYRCPGCGALSCSLPCVNAHKKATGCAGRRDRTAFVPITEFDDTQLVSDYTLLEEIIERRDAAKKGLQPGPPLPPGTRDGRHRPPMLPPPLAALRGQACNRGTVLHFLPSGMTRRKENSSFYDKRRRCIFWRVEWVFGGTSVRLATARGDENEALGALLAEHLVETPVPTATDKKLRKFRRAGAPQLRLCLKRESCPANRPEHVQLRHDESLRSQLVGQVVVEFPTIFVLLPDGAPAS